MKWNHGSALHTTEKGSPLPIHTGREPTNMGGKRQEPSRKACEVFQSSDTVKFTHLFLYFGFYVYYLQYVFSPSTPKKTHLISAHERGNLSLLKGGLRASKKNRVQVKGQRQDSLQGPWGHTHAAQPLGAPET